MLSRKLSLRGLAAATILAVSSVGAQDQAPALLATMHDTAGNSLGVVTISVAPNGVLVRAQLSGLEPGEHGFNIHDRGVCEAPPREGPEDPQPFQTAGGHLNPTDARHGFLSPDGPHAGDTPNLIVPETGAVSAEFYLPDIDLEMLMDSDRSTIVARAGPDNYTSGGSGGRIARGVIEQSA